MWAALVAVCGYVPVPLGREDYIELMPVKRQKINDYGIRIDYRTYDHKILNPYRGEASPTADGLWEIHYNPHAPDEVWVRLPKPGRPRGYRWEPVPWIHRTLVSAPFTDFTWQHVRSTVAQRGSRRDKVIAARARAHGAANAGGAVWGILYGQQPQTATEWPDEDDGFDHGEEAFAEDAEAEVEEADASGERQPLGPAGAEGLAVAGDNDGQARPARDSSVTVYDPFEEGLRW